jgi:hypothetical protein
MWRFNTAVGDITLYVEKLKYNYVCARIILQ